MNPFGKIATNFININDINFVAFMSKGHILLVRCVRIVMNKLFNSVKKGNFMLNQFIIFII